MPSGGESHCNSRLEFFFFRKIKCKDHIILLKDEIN